MSGETMEKGQDIRRLLDLVHGAMFEDTVRSLTDGPEAQLGLPLTVGPTVAFLEGDGVSYQPLSTPQDTIDDLRRALDEVLKDAPEETLAAVVRTYGSDDPMACKIWVRFDLCAPGYRRVAIHELEFNDAKRSILFKDPVFDPKGNMNLWVPPTLRTDSAQIRTIEKRFFSPLFGGASKKPD